MRALVAEFLPGEVVQENNLDNEGKRLFLLVEG